MCILTAGRNPGQQRAVNITHCTFNDTREYDSVSSDLRGEPVANRVHVVARSRRSHEGVRVAGEGVAIGREAVGGATVGREPALVHGGGRERLGSVQCATAVYNANV